MAKSKFANNYLAKRELSAQTVKAFNLGYANSESNSLYQLLLSKKFEIKDILESGLVKKSNKNQNEYYDFFRNRLIFPIKDNRSNIIAFGGRALDNSNIKYIRTQYISYNKIQIFSTSRFYRGG